MQNVRSRFLSAGLGVLFVLLGVFMFSTNADAQVYRAGFDGPYHRVFPDNAYRGSFRILNYPYIEIDGKQERLQPSTQIYDRENRRVPPTFLGNKRYVVNYVRFQNGALHSVWILSDSEMRERRQVADPKWWDKLFDTMGDVVDMAKWLGIAAL